MFSRKIGNDHKENVLSHNAVFFQTQLPNKKIVKLLCEKGVAGFLHQDVEGDMNDNSNWNKQFYKDGRITGAPSYKNRSSCCSFTKGNGLWYLFPIHKDALANVGLTEEDLVKWISYLNSMRVGFKYLYLGLQDGNEYMQNNWVNSRKDYCYTTNQAYWVAVPKFDDNNFRLPYIHWIALRYLINTNISSVNFIYDSVKNKNVTTLGEKERFSYYNIPRITIMLNEDYGLPKLKAFLYAHLANPFFSYYGLFYSDYPNITLRKPDVGLNNKEFKDMWHYDRSSSVLNDMLTQSNDTAALNVIGRKFSAPYDGFHLFKLVDAGDWKSFIKHIQTSYNKKGKKSKITKKKTNVKKEVIG
jgi:hypothetical protein